MPELSFNPDDLIHQYGTPSFAMAYGSGIFQQEGYSNTESPTLDFILGVNNPKQWHDTNLFFHQEDYSYLARLLGPEKIAKLQELGPGIYYNPYVDFEDDLGKREIKYGVISKKTLLDDLKNWTSLYTAGRLHKPTKILSSDPEIDKAIEENYRHALETALLLLPETFTEEELYMAIAGLSYTGDSRMKHAEDPNKVQNIVYKNMDHFSALYAQILAEHPSVETLSDGKKEQDLSEKRIIESCHNLPKELRDRIFTTTPEEHLSETEILEISIRTAISDIVGRSSILQTIKGLISSGPKKSLRYVREKREKKKRVKHS